MKKSFYFALAMTAGLFASCSSDDLSQAPAADFDVNDAENAVITIGVDGIQSFGATRGTGSILGKTWGGQQFNLFMFEKGTFTPAQYRATETSAPQDIFNNDTLTTGKGDSKAAYIVGGAEQFNYFPSTGSFDFWAYRADDAGQAPVEDVDTLKVPFEINGTQDLMIAITDTVKAANALLTAQPAIGDVDSAMTRIYSAYSARRGVNPKLKFSHLLTRLTFEVKAATRDVSEAASLKTTDDNEKKGFTITKVTVWSKSKGKIKAAYKAGIPADAERVEWDAAELWNDTTTLADFQLMSRDQQIEKADIKMVAISKDFRGSTATFAGTPSGYKLQLSNIEDDSKCYSSADVLDENTGEIKPTAVAVAFKDATASTVYIAAVKDGSHNDGDDTVTPAKEATKWDKHIVMEDASAQLKPLIPVVPKWDGYNDAAGWSPLPRTATKYTWDYLGMNAAGEGVISADPYGLDNDAITALKNAAKTSAPTETTTGAVKDVYCFYDNGVYRYYGLVKIAYNTDGAIHAAAVPTAAGTDGDMVRVYKDNATTSTPADSLYYRYHVAGAAVAEGTAVATPIGESMLVAPADDNGYWVEFTYTRTKKITASHVEPMVGSGLVHVKTAAGKKFAAGKTYKVTAILYSDGEINVEDILDADGDGPVDDYDDGSGDLDDGNNGGGYEIGE